MADDCVPWSTAWDVAAIGAHGFYRSTAGRAEDTFTTDVTAGPKVAERICDLAGDRLAALLSEHAAVTVTDVGAGDGTLLTQLMSALPRAVADGLRWRALDVRERPAGLDARIEWITGDARITAPGLPRGPGLVVAHEFLDDIPCDVVQIDEDRRRRLVLVRADGHESMGPPLHEADACAALGVDSVALSAWCERWWPRREPAARVEVGTTRDRAWRSILEIVDEGLAIAVDYSHLERDRSLGVWDGGTLSGYRAGRLTSPTPDGSCNITSHVAIDACAAAVEAHASVETTLQPSGSGDDLWWLVQTMRR